MEMKKFSHVFDIGFSVESDNDVENVTISELRDGLSKRFAELLASDDIDIVEACGFVDTSDNIDE
jgi:hypothetical protein